MYLLKMLCKISVPSKASPGHYKILINVSKSPASLSNNLLFIQSMFYFQYANWKMWHLKLRSQRNIKHLIYCLALIFLWYGKYIMRYGYWIPFCFCCFWGVFFAPRSSEGSHLNTLFCFHIILQSLQYVKILSIYMVCVCVCYSTLYSDSILRGWDSITSK